MLKFVAIIFGILLIFFGVIGFLPSLTQDSRLFNLFEVGNTRNIFYIVSGVLAIMSATSYGWSELYFRVFSIIFIIIAMLGFWRHGDIFLMQVNMADNILHVLIGVVMGYFGFFRRISYHRG